MAERRSPPVLLIHDVCCTGATMGVLSKAFRDRGYRVHARALADGCGEKPVVVRHTNGGLLALALAGLGSAAAVGLVPPAPPPWIGGAPLWLRRMFFSCMFGAGWETRAVLFRPRWPFTRDEPAKALLATLCPDSGPAMDEALNPARQGPFDPPCPLPCPAVVVAGTKDLLVPFDLTRRLARRFGAEHRVLRGAGHRLIGDPGHAASLSHAVIDILSRKGTLT